MWWNVRSTVSRSDLKVISSGFDGDRAGLDLREVENVVDERQQVGAGRMDVPGELDLLGVRLPPALSASC